MRLDRGIPNIKKGRNIGHIKFETQATIMDTARVTDAKMNKRHQAITDFRKMPSRDESPLRQDDRLFNIQLDKTRPLRELEMKANKASAKK